MSWGNNAKGHLIKHADVLGFGGRTPQQLQKMLPQLRSAAKITVPKSFVTPGSKNYIFMESNMMIDGFPGGTVLPNNLQKFNSAMKIDWIRY